MLASDLNNTQFQGAMDPDSVMSARFYKRAVHQPFLSEKEGRPIFKDVIYCEYWPAGSTLLKNDVPASDYHQQRFSKQWAYYQSTQREDTLGSGTPLTEWPILSPADVENLRGVKFFTIENIAGASDLQLQSIGMGAAGISPHVLRLKAQAYLGAAQDGALPQAQAAEINALKEQNAAMLRQMEELKAMLVKPAKAEKTPKASNRKKHKNKHEYTPEERAAIAERFRLGREKAAAVRAANQGT